jgi:hypothetical protein
MRHKQQNNVTGRCVAWESNESGGKISIIGLLIGVLILTSLAGAGGAATSLFNSGGGSWQYYREITLTEESGNTLTDYQVHVQLAGSNFPTTRPDGADIRFTDAADNVLSYWLESWDYSGKSASIWVKVPNIPANGNRDFLIFSGYIPFSM